MFSYTGRYPKINNPPNITFNRLHVFKRALAHIDGIILRTFIRSLGF